MTHFEKLSFFSGGNLQEDVLKNDRSEEKKMDEGTESRIEVTESKIEVELHQEKVDFINEAYRKGLRYWKRVALESISTENEARELIELAPRKVIFVRKAKNQKLINIEEIIFYFLKSQYS